MVASNDIVAVGQKGASLDKLGYSRDPGGYGQPPAGEQSLFVLAATWAAIIWAQRWVVLVIVAVCVALAGAISAMSTPTYLARVTIQIDREAQSILDVEGFNNVRANDAEFYQTQYENLRSRALAYLVVSNLNLANDEAIDRLAPAQSPWAMLLGYAVRAAGLGDREEQDNSASAKARQAVNYLLKHVSVAPVRNSRIVTVSFENEDPAFAQTIANGFADAFVRLSIDRRYQAAGYARTFLEEKLAQIKVKLEESESALVAYAQSQKLVDTEKGQPIASANLQSLNEKLIAARTERLEAEAAYRDSQSFGGMSLPLAQESRTLQILRSDEAKFRAEYEEKLGTLKPAYPEMVELQRKIDQTREQIAAEVRSIRESLKLRFEVAQSVEDRLETELQTESAKLFDLRERNIQYTILQREVDTNRALYDGLLQRYKEIGAAGGVELNNISIVDRAEIPDQRYSPNYMLNLLLGIAGGLALAIIAIIAREQLDESIKSTQALDNELGLVPLGLVPLLDARRPSESLEKSLTDGRTAYSEALRSIRTALQFSTQGGLPKVLLVTSARPSEGKSTMSSSLALSLSMLQKRVLLIDCDLRKPSQHLQLRVPNEAGTANLLTGGASFSSVIHKIVEGSFDLITAGPMPPNPAELLVGPRLKEILDEATSRYDIVILDGPPVLALADAQILARQAEATVLVVKASSTPARAVKDAKRRLEQVGANLIGAILNQYDMDGSHASYGYGYGGADQDGFSYGGQEIDVKKA